MRKVLVERLLLEKALRAVRYTARFCKIGDELQEAIDQPEQEGWVPVGERLPSGIVLVAYVNQHSSRVRVLRAEYVKAFTQEADSENSDARYDEATDTYYDEEGWYELIDNWGDYSSVFVTEGKVTHWMKLPTLPEVE